MIGVAAPSASSPSTSTSGPPIMKSVCMPETLTPQREQLVGAEPVGAVDRHRQAAAVRDVAARVLVEERVVEDEPGLPDARRAVDERDLAEERRLRVAARAGVRITSAPSPSALTSTISPALEADLEPVDAGADPGHDERIGRADDALGASPVGRREDLLGREVRHVRRSRSGSRTSRTASATPSQQTDDEIRSRARESGSRRSARSFERVARARCELGGVVAPRGDGIVARRAASPSRRRPRAARRRARRRRSRPARVRRGDDHPVDQPLRDERQVERAQRRSGSALPTSAGSRSSKSSGSGSPGELRSAPAGSRRQRAHPVEDVVRRDRRALLRAELDRGAAQVQVGDESEDAARAGPVAPRARSRARSRRARPGR